MMCQTETVGTDAARCENKAQNRASIRETQTVSHQPKNTEKAPKNGGLEPILGAVLVAGAEGLEPSARGFGVDVEKLAIRIAARVFGGVKPF